MIRSVIKRLATKKYFVFIPFCVTIVLLLFLTLNSLGSSKAISLAISTVIGLASFFAFYQNKKGVTRVPLFPINLWVLTISNLIGSYSAKYIVENTTLFLTNFNDRTIGIAVLNGLDIALRTNVYIGAIIIYIGVTLGTIFLFSKINNFLSLAKLEDDKNSIFTCSLISSFLLVFHYVNGAEIFIWLFDVFLFLTTLSFLISVAKIYFYFKRNSVYKLLTNFDLNIYIFILPLILFFIRWVFVKGSYIFTYQYFYLYFVSWASLWTGIIIFSKKLSNDIDKYLIAGTPLALIPISIPLSNEIQYTFSGIFHTSAQKVASFTVLLLIILTTVFFLLKNKLKTNIKIADIYLFPVFIATLVVFNAQVNFIEIPNGFDMFHHGENLISAQQYFNFGKIPFLNIYPTHGLSYMFTQFMYILVNGYSFASPWLWEWIRIMFEMILLYFVFRTLFGSLFAVSIIAFLPVLGVFGGKAFIYGYNTYFGSTYYFASFLTGLLLVKLVQKITYKNFILYWISILILFLWRVDFGLASFLAGLSIISLELLRIRKKENIKLFFKSLLIVSTTFVVLIISISVLNKISVQTITPQVLKFVSIQAQSQGLSAIAEGYTVRSVFQYYILPLIGISYVIYFLYRKVLANKKALTGLQVLLIYIAAFSLIISIRSIQRQTLATVGFNPYLFVFLLLVLPTFFYGFVNEKGKLFFVIGLFGYNLLFPNSTILIRGNRLVNLHHWKNKESRTHINDYQYKDIVNFLDDNLNSDQTFVDLTSSPMLYVASQREFITYLIPNSYETSETIQHNALKTISNYFDEGKIPIVIFRQKDSFANNIDGVPNEVRSYRIFEYIYNHYAPLGEIDGFQIWGAKGFKLKEPGNLTELKTFTQTYSLLKLPYYWGTYDKNFKTETPQKNLISENVMLEPNKIQVFDIAGNLDKSMGNYLYIEASSETAANINISLSKNSSINFNILPSHKNIYAVRTSTLWEWYTNSRFINIKADNKIVIYKMAIIKGD